jgi:type IV secretory pathway component VirB8
MTEQFFKEIADDVESGAYFEDAREWYHLKYSFPLIERSYCILFCLISFAIAFYTISIINSFFPLKKDVPIAVTIADTANYYAELKQLSVSRDANPNITLQKYLILRFLDAFENYQSVNNRDQILKNMKFIKKFSGPNVIETYAKLVSLNNPDGYIIKYRNGSRIAIMDKNSLKISYKKSTRDSISFTAEGTKQKQKKEDTYTASINFTTDEILPTGMQSEALLKKYKATMKYRFDDVSYDTTKKDFNPLIFKIISHTTTEIK